jgi:hypothetical protein
MDEFHSVSDAVVIGLKGFSGMKTPDNIRRQGQSSGGPSAPSMRVAPQHWGDVQSLYVVARYIPEMRLVRPHWQKHFVCVQARQIPNRMESISSIF